MTYKESYKDGVLTVSLRGELDHHGAAAARQGIDRLIAVSGAQKVVLELGEVCFCDSSGLGLLMGRYKAATVAGAAFAVKNPSPPVERMIKLAGLGRLIKIERSVEV